VVWDIGLASPGPSTHGAYLTAKSTSTVHRGQVLVPHVLEQHRCAEPEEGHQMATSREVQDELDSATRTMDEAKEKPRHLLPADRIAMAQVYATMALARAVDRLAERRP
jgi:hypothetical protein